MEKNNLAERKLQFIQAVSFIQDEEEIAQLENWLDLLQTKKAVSSELFKPIRKKLDPEAIKRSRNFKGHDREKIMRLIKEMDVQEPIELLLSQLTK